MVHQDTSATNFPALQKKQGYTIITLSRDPVKPQSEINVMRIRHFCFSCNWFHDHYSLHTTIHIMSVLYVSVSIAFCQVVIWKKTYQVYINWTCEKHGRNAPNETLRWLNCRKYMNELLLNTDNTSTVTPHFKKKVLYSCYENITDDVSSLV